MGEVPTPARLAINAALSRGDSATAALKAYRAEGGSIRTQTFYRLYGQAQLEGLTVEKEPSRPLHRAPTADETRPMTVKNPGGYLQKVVVLGRDKDGLVLSKHVTLKTDKLISRKKAITTAIGLIGEGLERYGITPITGFHTDAIELVGDE